MRIVSLVPGGTESVVAIGCERFLVGVSHECKIDRSVEVVTRAKFDVEGLSGEEIGRIYAATGDDSLLLGLDGGSSVEMALVRMRLCSYYWTDAMVLRDMNPNVIITVVDSSEMAAFGEVAAAARSLLGNSNLRIINYDPQSIGQIWSVTKEISEAAESPLQGLNFLRESQTRLQSVSASATSGPEGTRVAVVQWMQPLYLTGGWVPEAVLYAGGTNVLTSPGSSSPPSTWPNLLKQDPQVIVLAICGYDMYQTEKEVASNPEVCDALASFVRSKKRSVFIVDSTHLLSVPSALNLVNSSVILKEVLRSHLLAQEQKLTQGKLTCNQNWKRWQPAKQPALV